MAGEQMKGIHMNSKYGSVFSKIGIFALVALTACTAAQADDVSDSDRILCSISTLMLCTEDGQCFPLSVLDLDVPQFLVFDLKKKTISTTKASSENRVSEVANLVRENNRIFVQGVENNGAYSILIENDLGRFTGTVTRDGITVSTFGACTDANVR
jgi:hypothetical protein